MARPDITQLRSMELATTFRWSVKIESPPGLSFPDLNLYCESAELPTMTHAPVEINMRGHKVKANGIWSHSDEISLDFYETVVNDISKFLKAWRDSHWDAISCVSGTSAAIKTSVTLTRLDNTDAEIYRYKLFGVLLGGYTLPRLDASSEAWKPSVSLVYDYFTEEALK